MFESDRIAISLQSVGKMYKIYETRLDNFLDALGLIRLMPWRSIKSSEFWALRDISLELKVGSRLGIIGRNGAGKSTLLKLITGNLSATEGKVYVNGQVQALLEAGAGFHPEFTGYENIRAALIYQGFSSKEIEAAIEDITEFTELGQFLSQPFKTYSTGMQARLVFATATTLKPDILIIDEILGAGDAYFASKSSERMKQLVEGSGVSVLLVSHAMDQIIRYCDECIWIERGRIVQRGPGMEVVNSYEGFIHALEDRRLKAKNRKRYSVNYEPALIDNYGDAILLTFQLQGELGARCDITEVVLLKNGQVEETLNVGDVQDVSSLHASVLILDGSDWSEPQRLANNFCRSLAIQPDGPSVAQGYVVFYSYALFDDANYAIRVRYRCNDQAKLFLTLSRNGALLQNQIDLPPEKFDWVERDFPLANLHSKNIESPTENGKDPVCLAQQEANLQTDSRAVVHWPSEGTLTIEKVFLSGENGQEQAVFPVGKSLTLNMTILAHRSGHFDLVPGATLARLDGIFISNLVGESIPLDLENGETKDLRLVMNPLNLGNGDYVFSLSIFEKIVELESRYDLVARALEFEVIGNEPLVALAVFQHPGSWTVV